MLRRLLILNAGLIALLVIGAIKIRQDWQAFAPMHDLASIQPAPQTFPSLPAAVGATAAVSDWTEIPTKNPFSFDRTDVDLAVSVPTPPPPLGPKPILFGTFFLGLDRTAMIAPGQGASRNSRPIKVGQTIDGWTVVEIASKSIQIESNGVRETVIMNDPSAQVPRDSTRTLAAGTPAVQPVLSVTTTQPSAQPINAFLPALPAEPPQPPPAAPGQPQRRTRVVMTPFGPRTIFEDLPQ